MGGITRAVQADREGQRPQIVRTAPPIIASSQRSAVTSRRLSGHLLLHVMVNWVCFDCRWAGRRSGSVTDVACTKCGEPAVFLGTKIEVPPKSKISDWKALREWYYAAGRAIEHRIYAETVRRRHDLERKIRDLSARPENVGRASWIKRLQSQLEALQHDV